MVLFLFKTGSDDEKIGKYGLSPLVLSS